MALRNKAASKPYYKPINPEETKVPESQEDPLYSQFKSLEKELKKVLESKVTFPTILEQHVSFTNPKKQLLSIISQIFSNASYLPLIESKRLDERFWVLIKKELRRIKAEKKSKPSLLPQYLDHIASIKDSIALILKQSWPVLEPLKDPHFHDSFVRKLFCKLFMCLGETLKQKLKSDKSILPEVKEFYMRSNKVFSFSPRCQELLGSNP